MVSTAYACAPGIWGALDNIYDITKGSGLKESQPATVWMTYDIWTGHADLTCYTTATDILLHFTLCMTFSLYAQALDSRPSFL